LKINIQISKDGEKFEEFVDINFDELDGLTIIEQKKYIEDYCRKAVEKIALDNISENKLN
jgi:hypothetical protein